MTYTVQKITEPLLSVENGDRDSLNEINQNTQDLIKQLEQLKSVLTLASATVRSEFELIDSSLSTPIINALVGSLALSVELTSSIQNSIDTKIEIPIWRILNTEPA
jgi:hypothetical protein